MISKKTTQYPKTIIVRITACQYERLLEAIIKQNNRSRKSDQEELTPVDKSKILREMIDRYLVQKIS